MPAGQPAPAQASSPAKGSTVAWATGAAGLGALSVESPLLAAVGATTAILAALPLWSLFAVLALATLVQRWSITVAGLTVLPSELVVTVFALRAFALRKRSPLGKAEWILAAFLGLQVITSWLNAPDVHHSLLAAGLLGFGALAYVATVVAVSDRDRLRVASRWFLGFVAVAAASGIALLAAHYVSSFAWGITRVDTLRGFPAIQGFAHEHNVFGSTCAAGALAFIVLWRERIPLFSARISSACAWILLAGLLLSLSRGAWVGFGAGLAAYSLAKPRTGRSLLAFGVSSCVVALMLAATATAVGPSARIAYTGGQTAVTIGSQASAALSFSTSTGARRLVEWKGALHEVQSSPLVGLGTNSWGDRHLEQTRFGSIPAFLGNWLIRTLYDSGVIGLGLLLWFLSWIAWPGSQVRRARGESAGVARAFVFASVALLVAYLATDALLLIWPWLLFGLARSARRLASADQ